MQNLRTMNAGRGIGALALFLALSASASPASTAANDECQTVSGKAVWTLIPAPDALGRVLGPTTGTLKGAVSAYLTSLTPGAGGFNAESVEVWVLGPQDTLTFDGNATFTPIDGAPIGTVADSLTLTVTNGTGKYAGATGTLHVTGTGYNLFGPGARPGGTFFDVRYEGTICTVN